MILRLYYNKQNADFKEPMWVVHIEDTNEVHKLDKVISFGAPHETEKAPQLPNLKADWVIKYYNCVLKVNGKYGFIHREEAPL